MEERSYNGGTSQMFVSRHSSSALHMWRCCSSCSHRRSLTAAGQFILATKYLNAPPFDELPLVHVAVAMKSTLRHISPHAIQFHCTVATFFVPLPTPARSPIHPFMNEPSMSACIKSAVEVRQLRGSSALVLDWPGLAWAGQSIIAYALASYLVLTSIFASLLCCECSFLLVHSSEACQFPLKCFGFVCRAFSGFVLHVHFNLLHVSYAFYGIQWRHSNRCQCFYNRQGPSSTLALLQLCHVMWWSVQIVKIVKTVQYIL